jgi:hypothetical protein
MRRTDEEVDDVLKKYRISGRQQKPANDRANKNGKYKHRLEFTRFRDICLSTAARYLMKGIIPIEGIVVVWGPPKCGKSFLVFDMVCHIALGKEYRGRRVKQCPVVYFAFEGQVGFQARAEAFRRHHGEENDPPLYLCCNRVLLPDNGMEIVKAIEHDFPDVKPGVVVLDTLNRSIKGSENAPEDMTAYIRAADLIRDRFNCAVIIIHHCGVDGDRPRGHTSLTAAADAQIAVRRDAANNVVAEVEYMKDGPEGDQLVSALDSISVGITDEGEEITSCVVRPVDGPPVSGQKARRLSDRQRLALDALTECVLKTSESPPISLGLPAGIRVVQRRDWQDEMYRRNVLDKDAASPREDFRRLCNQLQARKLIGLIDGLVWQA